MDTTDKKIEIERERFMGLGFYKLYPKKMQSKKTVKEKTLPMSLFLATIRVVSCGSDFRSC